MSEEEFFIRYRGYHPVRIFERGYELVTVDAATKFDSIEDAVTAALHKGMRLGDLSFDKVSECQPTAKSPTEERTNARRRILTTKGKP